MNSHEPTDGLDTPALVTAGLVAAIGTFAMIVALQVLYLNFEAAEQKESGTSTAASSASLMAEQRSKINSYGWLDRQNDVVAIPIDLAIELTARELAGETEADEKADTEVRREPSS